MQTRLDAGTYGAIQGPRGWAGQWWWDRDAEMGQRWIRGQLVAGWRWRGGGLVPLTDLRGSQKEEWVLVGRRVRSSPHWLTYLLSTCSHKASLRFSITSSHKPLATHQDRTTLFNISCRWLILIQQLSLALAKIRTAVRKKKKKLLSGWPETPILISDGEHLELEEENPKKLLSLVVIGRR